MASALEFAAQRSATGFISGQRAKSQAAATRLQTSFLPGPSEHVRQATCLKKVAAAKHAPLTVHCSTVTPAQPALASAPALPHVKWSARAIKAFGMAELEARKLKYPTTGSEALLMGMLTEGTSTASRFLRSKGIRLMELRDETVKLLGKADMYFFSPEHPPLTPQASAALQWAIDEHQRQGGQGEITPELILLGIWAQKEAGAGYKLLSNLGFTEAHADELRKLL